MLRGGAFKPRTSPYAFQGLHDEGIRLLLKAKQETGLPIVTEIMSYEDIDLFEQVDFGDCTFRDVRFEQCRFIGCTMGKGWLNRVDLRDCSAPGLSLLQARLSQVSAAACDLSFANISETSIDHMALRDCRMREAAFQRAKLRHVSWADCDLTRIDVFGTSLAGIDVSTCLFQAPVLSGDYRELRGLVVSPEQALSLATLLGVRIAEE